MEARVAERERGRSDWSSWPAYDAAGTGLRNYWYPVRWSNTVTDDPEGIVLCGEKIMIMRDVDGRVHALHDRCPHRGVKLSEGDQQFPGTVSCPYHGWTFGLEDGDLRAVITDGPDSPICGKVSVRNYPVEERLGMVWVFVGDRAPHPIDEQLPEELVANPDFTVGGRIAERRGNWRLACENGFDEGHAKYLHRTAWWRQFRTMPTWNKTHIERRGRWLYRVQDEVFWEAEFPGLGVWTNKRWWRKKPPAEAFNVGNVGAIREPDPEIAAQDFPGFACVSMPGVLRIVYPNFIHYEYYVPVDEDTHLYVGQMVQWRTGASGAAFRARYLAGIRWFFHGSFSDQDAWMVEETDAPPERLYRPDTSLTAWRRLVQEGNPFDPPAPAEGTADTDAEEAS
ncbi:aromatic ring-hydroxylating dioxygenase subunit alpha [Nitriliruptoraceae bacterium ZYF776]|nr:aromatic ring-hydroxylating dioxygenase subunit alpha [Profundirhabdus halotolerans]